jgi:hypothetical protein
MHGVCGRSNPATPACSLVSTVTAPLALAMGVLKSAMAMPIIGPPKMIFAARSVRPPQWAIKASTVVPRGT